MQYKVTLESDVNTLDEQGKQYSAVHCYDVPEKLWKLILSLTCETVPYEKRHYVPT